MSISKSLLTLLPPTVIVALFVQQLNAEAFRIAQTVAVYGTLNAMILARVPFNAVPYVAVIFNAACGPAVRAGFHAYVVFAAATISLFGIAAISLVASLFVWLSPSVAIAATSIMAVAVFTALASLAFVDRLVYDDFGVHVFEFDILDVLRDGVSRKHIGVRPEDLRRIYLLLAALLGVQALLYVVASWASALAAVSFATIITIGLAATAAAAYLRFRRCCAAIPNNNFEFFDALPLAAHLLLNGSRRPFISVRVKRGPSGYPELNAADEVPSVRNHKNIIVLFNDGLRADHVSREAGLTPNICDFIERNQAYVSRRHFSSSHFTDQSVFGMFYGVDAFNYVPFLQEKIASYPLEVLKRNGYVTAFFTHSILGKFPNHWLMDLFDESADARSDEEVVEMLDRFLERRREDSRPYIVFAFVYTPHWPYEFHEAFAVDRPHTGMSHAAHETRTATKNSYRNAVRQADDFFRQITELCEPQVRSGDTIFAYTSDHGTEFWEHDAIIGQGKATFWKEKVEVPFFLVAPGAAPFAEHSHTSHVDLMPTLLHLLGVEADPSAFSDGFSVSAPHTVENRTVIISGRLFPYANRSNAVVDGRTKCWFRSNGVNSEGKLDFAPFRTMTLEDVEIPQAGDTEARFDEFQIRFFRYLEVDAGVRLPFEKMSSGSQLSRES
jgi:membrane-anchored protein YejM (alkaline phosphatase superfamily)